MQSISLLMNSHEIERLQQLAGHIGFEFDGSEESVHHNAGYGMRATTVINDLGQEHFAEFTVETRVKPSLDVDATDGIVAEDLDAKHWEWEELEPNPDAAKDESLHGLFEARKGYIAIYSKYSTFYPSLDKLYRFRTTNAANGANNTHMAIGRLPGQDIPRIVEFDNDLHEFWAGQITEAIANMQILAPGKNDFGTVTHDLGNVDVGDHGLSWAHTHPAYYRHLSRVAQEVIEEYGSRRIHFETPEEKANRPRIVIDIALALDGLLNQLNPSIREASLLELRIRDGRYATLTDEEIKSTFLEKAFKRFRHSQKYQILGFEGVGDAERYKRGYWTRMQLLSGVLQTRISLHEVRQHPKATDSQTKRTLDVLSALKAEVDRRVADNREYALAD